MCTCRHAHEAYMNTSGPYARAVTRGLATLTHGRANTRTQDTNTHCLQDAGIHPCHSHTHGHRNTHAQRIITHDVLLHTCEQTGPHMSTHTCRRINTRSQAQRNTQVAQGCLMCARARMHARTHARTHAHTHSQTCTCARALAETTDTHADRPKPAPPHAAHSRRHTAHSAHLPSLRHPWNCLLRVGGVISGRVVSPQGPRVSATTLVLPGPLVLRWT